MTPGLHAPMRSAEAARRIPKRHGEVADRLSAPIANRQAET
jgi:hypothetical protein